MSKVTVITNAAGEIIAIGQGHLSEQTAMKVAPCGFQAGLRAGPGQQLHELDIPENLAQITTWPELVTKVGFHFRHP